jgi:hypothetical protein
MILLVADARETTRAAVRAASNALGHVRDDLVGCVLDRVGRAGPLEEPSGQSGMPHEAADPISPPDVPHEPSAPLSLPDVPHEPSAPMSPADMTQEGAAQISSRRVSKRTLNEPADPPRSTPATSVGAAPKGRGTQETTTNGSYEL